MSLEIAIIGAGIVGITIGANFKNGFEKSNGCSVLFASKTDQMVAVATWYAIEQY